MQEDLLKIIYDYALINKELDDNFFIKIGDLYISHKSLENQIKNIVVDTKITPDRCDHMASYRMHDSEIFVALCNIKRIPTIYKCYYKLLNSFEEKLFYYLVAAQIMIHEIEHAHQEKISSINETIEEKILKLSKIALRQEEIDVFIKNASLHSANPWAKYFDYAVVRTQNYRKQSVKAPFERLAEIRSHQELYSAISQIKRKVPFLMDFMSTSIMENRVLGYEVKDGKLICPTVPYIEGNGTFEEFKKFSWYDEDYVTFLIKCIKELSYEERFDLGLPLTPDEYNSYNKTMWNSCKKRMKKPNLIQRWL